MNKILSIILGLLTFLPAVSMGERVTININNSAVVIDMDKIAQGAIENADPSTLFRYEAINIFPAI